MIKSKMLIKTIVSILLSFLLVISTFHILTAPTLAAQDGDFTYELIDNGTNVSITGYTGSGGEVSIPNLIGEKIVTNINTKAFRNCTSLTTITIPNTVTSIGEWAFSRCSSLTTITIPNSVTSIGMCAFEYCSSLTVITIPNSVASINFCAFSACSNLTTITIPNSITYIGFTEFGGCSSLAEINVDENNVNYTSIDGVLFNKDNTELILYPEGKVATTYIIPNSVKNIAANAFLGCTKLTEISIPDSVTSIGSSAFEGCEGLTSMIIPNGIAIRYNTFAGCTNLATVTIPDSIILIEGFAFSNCTSLTTITIPNSVTSIEKLAFMGCTNLTTIIIPNSVTSIGKDAFIYCTSLKIYGEEDSYAEQYAKEKSISFILAFPDIETVEWANDAIINLACANVIKGYDDGTFRPDNNITRAEFIKMLVLAFDVYNPNATSTFTDLPAGEWYNSYVATAQMEGLAKGNGDGTFLPESTITREEMFIFCARAIEIYKEYEILNKDSNEINPQLDAFKDGNTVNEWAKEYVASVIKYGLVAGSPVEDGKALYPQNTITRAEVAVVLYRTMLLTPKTK